MPVGLPPSSPISRSTVFRSPDALLAQLGEEMVRRWQGGERPLVEEFLARHPHLAEQPSAVVDLLYEEINLRQQYGEQASWSDLVARFPRWKEPLRLLLDCHHLLGEEARPPSFPEVGETLGDYLLLTELGRGALGRVFLATQQSLANRRVVLKVVPLHGREHLSLARLQHTHIMPLYAVHDDSTRAVRVLCMPYFGSVTLARLREALARLRRPSRTGQDLLQALVETTIPGVRGADISNSPARNYLTRSTFVEGICWIGLCLAEGLHYAHEHGLVHFDVKPSNVLLGSDGQPMLLDFHLAQPPLSAGAPPPDWLGGTPGHMAPEQQAALAAVRLRQPLAADVGPPADIFSLGALLYEMLGGEAPYQPGQSPPLHSRNPAVGVGLSDVIHKCLAREPARRYASAGDLAGDLRNVLAGRPLQGVRNRSLRERWQRWRRRRPHLRWLLVLGVALVFLSLVSVRHWRQRLHQAERMLLEGQSHLRQEQYEAAKDLLWHGLALVDGWPGGQNLTRQLNQNLEEARRRQVIHELHALVERLRSLYPFDSVTIAALRTLADRFQTTWEKLHQFGVVLGADLEPAARVDLLDLAIFGTDLRVRLAGDQVVRVREECLEVLDRAESLLGPSPVLTNERSHLLRSLGRPERTQIEVQKPVPRTAWEYHALGSSFLRSGELDRAADYLEQAVRMQPEGLWPNFYRGQCCYQQHRYREALLSFSVCIGASPQVPACWFNRALCCAALGDGEQAVRDYQTAFRLDPSLAVAALNCGILHFQAGRYAAAEKDLRTALRAGADPAAVYFNLALVFRATRNLSAALESVAQSLRHNPRSAEAITLQKTLQAERKRANLPLR
jgi:serine/threonine protein kinase/tetratricopeptide (TPR) repeat protein